MPRLRWISLILVGALLLLPACWLKTDSGFGRFDGVFYRGTAEPYSIIFRADSIDDFFNEFVEQFLNQYPETATWVGDLGDAVNVIRRDDELDTWGYDPWFYEFSQGALDKLLSFEESSLSEDQLLYRDMLLWTLRHWLESREYEWHGYIANHYNGFQVRYPLFMQTAHEIQNIDDAENYISRLAACRKAIDETITAIEDQRGHGILSPRLTVDNTLDSLRVFINTPPEENMLYTIFAGKLDLVNISGDKKSELLNQALRELENTVYPAYRRLGAYLTQYEPAEETQGVWSLPQGKEYYEFLVRYYTTTDMTPEEVHELGHLLVAEASNKIMAVLKQMGMDHLPMPQALWEISMGNIRTDRDQLLTDYQRILADAQELLPKYFDTLPAAAILIEPIPDFLAQYSSHYYTSPSRNGNRPGIFHLNLSYDHEGHTMKNLTFHEAVPGHHLQLTLQQENHDIPLFGEVANFTAFAEGWATYAEGLFFENGEFADDLTSRIGWLEYELFGAVMLVLETGIHYYGWSEAEAVEYSESILGWSFPMDRYLVWPGQVLSYQVGAYYIRNLRNSAEEQLGEFFDIREFHTVILENGAMPLAILERQVEKWIEMKKQTIKDAA